MFRNVLFLLAFLWLGGQANAQNTVRWDDPCDGTKRAAYTITPEDAQWQVENTQMAERQAPEYVFGYIKTDPNHPSFKGTTRLESPMISCKTLKNPTFSFRLYFYSTSQQTDKTIGVGFRLKGEDDWEDVVLSENTINNTKKLFSQKIPSRMALADSMQFCIYIISKSGTSVQYLCYIDDILVADKDEYHVSMAPRFADFLTEKKAPTFPILLRNLGKDFREINISYQVDKGEVKTQGISQNIIFNDEYTVNVTPETWALEAGSHTIRFWNSRVNADIPTQIDTLEMPLYMVDTKKSVPYRMFFEMFTSASCDPCAVLNPQLEPVFKEYEGQYSMIKYQMNFPAPGDIYYIPCNTVRSNLYGVAGVPKLFAEGEVLDANNITALKDRIATLINSAPGRKAYFDIKINRAIYDLDSMAYITYTVTPKVSGTIVIHTALIEHLTTKNANKEPSFMDVSMGMFPDGHGITLQCKADSTMTFEYQVDLRKTFAEELSDLNAIVFVQNPYTNGIYQVADLNLTFGSGIAPTTPKISVSIYPNPAQNTVNVELEKTSKLELFDISGRPVWTANKPAGTSQISVSNIPNGTYLLRTIQGQTSRFDRIVVLH